MIRLFLSLLLSWSLCGAAAAAQPVVLVWGDSLSAAYGMDLEQGWVALLQRRLREQGYPHAVVNGSVSGETTAGGLARLPDALARHRPAVLVIELGGNDGLRGLPLGQMRANLQRMVTLGQQAGARVALLEMRIPTNYGPEYAEGFRRVYGEVARATGAVLVPFFLGAIATDPEMFLDDGIHPAAAAQPILLDAVWPHIRPLLDATARR